MMTPGCGIVWVFTKENAMNTAVAHYKFGDSKISVNDHSTSAKDVLKTKDLDKDTQQGQVFVNHPRVDPRTAKNSLMGNQSQDPSAPPLPHPMAVSHLGHLMSHIGILVLGLFGAQVLAAWNLADYVTQFLDVSLFLYFGIGLFLMLALDTVAWLRLRGKLIEVFFIPVAVLYVITFVLIVTLYYTQLIQAL